MTTQLSLWDNEDSRPLPLIAADKWGFVLSYVDTSGNPENYLYSIQDWIVGLTGATNQQASDVWRKSDYGNEIHSSKLPYQASNGRTYQMDFTDAKGVYRIAQDLRPMKKRPELEKVLAEIYNYLAEAGAFVDFARREPAKAAAMITERAKGIQARNDATLAFQATHVKGDPQYWVLTEAENEILLGATKTELIKQLKLTKQQAKRFRDQFGELTLQAFRMAETASAIKMRELGRKLTDSEQLEIVRQCSRMVAPAFHQLVEYLNVDKVRNQPMLKGANS